MCSYIGMSAHQTNTKLAAFGPALVESVSSSPQHIAPIDKQFGTSRGQGPLSPADIDRVIEMAWEDRTPFDAITAQFGLKEAEVIALMRREMKASSWRMWRARVQGRKTKHKALSPTDMDTFRCSRQRMITHNKISKR